MRFPIDVSSYKHLKIPLSQKSLTRTQLKQLITNINIVRDSIVFFTGLAGAKGLGGHTGGPYDITPEILITDALMRANPIIYPVHFDEAGHRVAIQYVLMALHGHISWEQLLHYREFKGKLPGHPEIGITPGLKFSSGRLGHMWGHVNGVARAHPDKKLMLFGSDGSQQEGNDAEAARFAVAHNLDVTLILDDNDVTISGHPSEYLPGYKLSRTLQGHNMPILVAYNGNLQALYRTIRKAILHKGPIAVIRKRRMAPGIPVVEGKPKGHDVVPVDAAIEYLARRQHDKAVLMLRSAKKVKSGKTYLGSSREYGKNRDEFGKIVNELLGKMSPSERKRKVMVIDNDLAGSTGLHHIKKKYPDIFVDGGIMERGNYLAAAGFGSTKGRQGIYATFSAFQEMILSEITMSRLNDANVIAHFSHAGVDWMADNTCHFGLNNFFAHNGLEEGDTTRLYFPADVGQMKGVLNKVFYDPGLRFVYSTRAPVPHILKKNGELMYGPKYKFTGKDEVLREGKGYIVAYGEMLYRCLDAVEKLQKQGIKVGLVNKTTLNVVDEAMMKKLGKAKFVLVVESQNKQTGLGSRFGTWLLERGYSPRYDHMGSTKIGEGGVYAQMGYQGLESSHIMTKVKGLLGK
jgi:transketolase